LPCFVHQWKLGVPTSVILVAFALFFGADAVAQAPTGVPSGETKAFDADALVCWRKADRSSIRVGEEFRVTLTCRLAETGMEKTVLNESLLDPGAVVLSPYRVKGGTRWKEINRVLPGPDGPVTFRTVQYSYTVTLIDEGFFGKDVPLPPLEIRYHVDLATNRDSVTPGKERTYVLAPLPMRIQSLVPKAADSIRDTGGETFGTIEYLRKSALIAFTVAGIFLLLPPALLLPRLFRAVRGRREDGSNGTVFRESDLLGRLARELGRLEKSSRTAPWDDASVGSALALLRVCCALGVGRRITQTPVGVESRGLEGQIKLRKGFCPRTKVLVSTSFTPEAMAAELAGAKGQGAAPPRRTALLDEARRAFTALNDARYAAPGNAADRAVFDGALKTGLRLLHQLRRDRQTGVRMARAVAERGERWIRKWNRS
jgi:hypothetical protein